MERLNIISLFCVLSLIVVFVHATPRQERPRGGRQNRTRLPAESGEMAESSDSTNPVRIISIVKSTGSADTNSYEVRFNQRTSDIVLKAFAGDDYVNVTRSEEGGISVATFEADKDARNVYFATASRDLVNHLTVRMDNSRSGPARQSQTVPENPEMSVDPPGDIVYNRGVNATITARVRRVDRYSYGPILQAMPSVLNLDTNKFTEYSSDAFVNETDGEQGEQRVDIVIRTAVNPLSGYVKLLARRRVRDGFLKRVYVMKSLVLRPRGQAEAFPRGYINARDSARQVIDDFCYARRQDCHFFCAVTGLNITHVKVYEMRDGAWDQIQSSESRHRPYYDFYYREYTWSVSPSSLDEAGGSKQFKCEAEDGVTGNVASTEYSISTDVGSAVVQDASNFTIVVETPEEPTEKTVTLNCVLTGTQRPVVNITLYYYGRPKERVSPDTVTRVSPGRWLATKVVTFDTEGVTQDSSREFRRYPEDVLRKARCSIFSGRYATSYIEFRDIVA